jgi:hypothetical protein
MVWLYRSSLSAPDKGELPAPYPDLFTSDTHCREGGVGPKAGLNAGLTMSTSYKRFITGRIEAGEGKVTINASYLYRAPLTRVTESNLSENRHSENK